MLKWIKDAQITFFMYFMLFLTMLVHKIRFFYVHVVCFKIKYDILKEKKILLG